MFRVSELKKLPQNTDILGTRVGVYGPQNYLGYDTVSMGGQLPKVFEKLAASFFIVRAVEITLLY
jgi:hypothetical protein